MGRGAAARRTRSARLHVTSYVGHAVCTSYFVDASHQHVLCLGGLSPGRYYRNLAASTSSTYAGRRLTSLSILTPRLIISTRYALSLFSPYPLRQCLYRFKYRSNENPPGLSIVRFLLAPAPLRGSTAIWSSYTAKPHTLSQAPM